MGENPKVIHGQGTADGPRVGVPYRIVKEELSGERQKYDRYLRAIELAGGIAAWKAANLPAVQDATRA